MEISRLGKHYPRTLESCFYLEEKGVYKDTYHEIMDSEDLQIRPNFVRFCYLLTSR